MSDEEKRDRKRAYDAARYQAKRDEINARNKAWNTANAEKRKIIYLHYRAANLDRLNAKGAEYRSLHADRARAAVQAWRRANPDYNSDYYAANRDAVRKGNAQWYAKNKKLVHEKSNAWYAANPEKKKAKERRYYEANGLKFTAAVAKRRAARIQRTPRWFGEFDELVMAESYRLCKLRRHCTGIDWELDHVLPLQAETVSGLHCGLNVQVIPAICNRRKNNAVIYVEPLEWLHGNDVLKFSEIRGAP